MLSHVRCEGGSFRAVVKGECGWVGFIDIGKAAVMLMLLRQTGVEVGV
jgi:hypothetical protein